MRLYLSPEDAPAAPDPVEKEVDSKPVETAPEPKNTPSKDEDGGGDRGPSNDEFRTRMRALLPGSGASLEQQEQAMRAWMAEEGYNRSDIDQFVDSMFAPPEEAEPQPRQRQKAASDDEVEENPELTELRRQLQQLQQTQEQRDRFLNQQTIRQHQKYLQEQTSSVIDRDEKLSRLVQDEVVDPQFLETQINLVARQEISNRRARTGEPLSDTLIDDAVNKAVASISRGFRSGIDKRTNDRLPETDTGDLDAFLEGEPPKPPVHDGQGDHSAKVRSFISQALKRARAERERGPSKV